MRTLGKNRINLQAISAIYHLTELCDPPHYAQKPEITLNWTQMSCLRIKKFWCEDKPVILENIIQKNSM